MNQQRIDLKTLAKKWPEMSVLLSTYKTRRDYNQAVSVLDQLLDEVGEDEKHPLSSLIDTLGLLIEDYESRTLSEPSTTPIEVLTYLMQEHSLTQRDLPEIGSQGVVSEVLSGKRELNKRQIKSLSKRFGVSPLVFFDMEDDELEAA